MGEPYRITIEHWNYKISVEVDRSDITLEEYIDLLKSISLAAGWGVESVNEIFDR